jgi:catechol 2,3-dioxygenase-like lactoylglutathione lyase family enzyme
MVPFAIRQLDHVVFRVRDLAHSIAFYQRVLGCHVVKERPDLGLVHLRAGGSMIDLVSIDGTLGKRGGAAPQSDGRNVDHICLHVDPFDAGALQQHLQRCGIAASGPVTVNFGAAGDGPSLYIRDPDGNVIELKGYPGTSNEAIS